MQLEKAQSEEGATSSMSQADVSDAPALNDLLELLPLWGRKYPNVQSNAAAWLVAAESL